MSDKAIIMYLHSSPYVHESLHGNRSEAKGLYMMQYSVMVKAALPCHSLSLLPSFAGIVLAEQFWACCIHVNLPSNSGWRYPGYGKPPGCVFLFGMYD